MEWMSTLHSVLPASLLRVTRNLGRCYIPCQPGPNSSEGYSCATIKATPQGRTADGGLHKELQWCISSCISSGSLAVYFPFVRNMESLPIGYPGTESSGFPCLLAFRQAAVLEQPQVAAAPPPSIFDNWRGGDGGGCCV